MGSLAFICTAIKWQKSEDLRLCPDILHFLGLRIEQVCIFFSYDDQDLATKEYEIVGYDREPLVVVQKITSPCWPKWLPEGQLCL